VKDSPVMMILLALLAVAGTLGGVWLGRYLERDNEALKWRREHALQAYTEVLRACAVVMDEADNIYHMEPSAERVAQGKLLFEKVAEMYRLSDRVTLLGPREIHASVDALTRYYGTKLLRVHRKLLNHQMMNGGYFERVLPRSI
jgi:hypothetical protein